MENMREFCKKIEIQDEITELVAAFDEAFDYETIKYSMDKLFFRVSWNEGRAEIKEALGEDERGIKILAVMLKCAMKTWDKFMAIGMEESILVETMKCFKRFMDEHMASYGSYAFDRDFWTARQASGNLFRIGELEYELIDEGVKKTIGVHIPSDVRLKKEIMADSYKKAKACMKQFFPEFDGADMECESWLLSPSLKEVLSPESNIIKFQNAFRIVKVDYDNNDFMEWVFKRPDLALEELPEDTSLQKNLKKYLLDGGKVGEAVGILVEPAFV